MTARGFCRLYKQVYLQLKQDLSQFEQTSLAPGTADARAKQSLLRAVFLAFLHKAGYLTPAAKLNLETLARSWQQARNLAPTFFADDPEDLLSESGWATVFTAFDHYHFCLPTAPSAILPSDPAIVTPALLRTAFAELSETADRKSQGIFYTPLEIVDYMSQQSLVHYLATVVTEPIPIADWQALIAQHQVSAAVQAAAPAIDRALTQIRLCDPAIGAGNFPLMLVQQIARLRHRLTSNLGLPPPTRTLTSLYWHTLDHCIYGVDIDPAAIEMAHVQLWLLLLAQAECPLTSLPNLDRQILCADALATDRQGLSLKTQFAAVFAASAGFDLIIGNPPYVRVHKQNAKLKAPIKEHFYAAYRDYDLYILFFEVGLELLRSDGILVFITPDKFLVRDYGKKIRELIFQYSVLELFDISRVSTAFHAAAYPLISLIQKNQKTESIHLKSTTSLKHLTQASSRSIPRKTLTSESLIQLYRPDDAVLIQKIFEQSNRLSDYLEKHQIFCGTPRAKDYHLWKDFIVAKSDLEPYPDSQTPPHVLLRLLCCGHLRPYQIDHQKQVRTIGQSIREPYFCNQTQMIHAHRWLDFCQTPKILIRGNDTRITAALDTIGSVFIGIYGIKIYGDLINDYPYLLGLLNSSLYQWIFAVQNPSIRIAGGFFSINAPQLLQLPFKSISPPQQTQIQQLVNQILQLTQDSTYNTRSHLQQQVQTDRADLDRLIYATYDLTEAEIRQIETALAPKSLP